MKKILIHMPGFERGRLFDSEARDSCLEPFIYLRDKLRELGYQLETYDEHPVKDCAWVLFWDIPRTKQYLGTVRKLVSLAKSKLSNSKSKSRERDVYEECIQAGLRDRTAVFLAEPPVTTRRNWDSRNHELFPYLFTWNDDLVDGKRYFKFHYPLTRLFPDVAEVPFKEKKLLVNISGNNFSRRKGELYSARRDAIRYFEQHQPKQFDLYGLGWDSGKENEPPYSSYRGTVKHKWDVYPRYRFGLCYENTLDAPGYITEKIFDCMRAKCVPIYLGAPNVAKYVDTTAFIDRRQFESNAELEKFLLGMTESEYARHLDAIRCYLTSDRFASFLPPAFADTIIRTLHL